MAPRSRIFASLIAAATGIVGCASLLLFGFFLWHGALGVVALQMTERGVAIWDAGLCLIFFVQHSGMIRRSFRVLLERALPEHWHRLIYTNASGVVLLLLVGLWQRSTTNLYVAEGAARWAIGGILAIAFAGVVWGIGSLKRFDAFGIEAFLSHGRGEKPAAELTIAGPYRLVRHPFYGCGIVALWAAPVLSVDRLVLNTLFTGWILVGATLEERDLAAEFGEAYRAYQKTVPMFLPRGAAWRGYRG